MHPSFWLARPAPPEEVDVAVVGGGIVGISTAYWLGRAGRRALVLEAGAVASRASGRNAGFLMTGTREPYAALAAAIGEARARWLWETASENRELVRAELLDSGRVDSRPLERRAQGPAGAATLPAQLVQAVLSLAATCARAGLDGSDLPPDVKAALVEIEQWPVPLASLATFCRDLVAGDFPSVPAGLPEDLSQFLGELLTAVEEARRPS